MLATVAGQLPSWVLVAVTVAVAWRIARAGGGSAVSELERSNGVLEHALDEERKAHQRSKDVMGGEIRDLRVMVADLQARTDVAAAIEAWGAGHEERAQQRQVAILGVLELIAVRLGKDPNGA